MRNMITILARKMTSKRGYSDGVTKKNGIKQNKMRLSEWVSSQVHGEHGSGLLSEDLHPS
jgi:hypothetical protein